MRAILLLILALARLVWWDVTDKIRITLSWDLARRYIDQNVSKRARALFGLARFTVGLRVRLELDEQHLPEQMIILANHQSVIDIVIIMAAFRHHSVRFVAKAELRQWFPAVSRVLRVQRHALIQRRGDYSQAMLEINRLGHSLRGRECPVIFPEGTRSRDGRVLPFQSGAVRRLHAARPLPIVALALDGGWQFAGVNDLRHLSSKNEYRLTVAAVFPRTAGKHAVLRQIATAQQAIESTLNTWRTADDR